MRIVEAIFVFLFFYLFIHPGGGAIFLCIIIMEAKENITAFVGSTCSARLGLARSVLQRMEQSMEDPASIRVLSPGGRGYSCA